MTPEKTPEKKAKMLVEKFGDLATDVVDEILNIEITNSDSVQVNNPNFYTFWKQVREAIETLK